jgi:ppGpp synthetase/RelA/SpoT-type nucleotidyltranferase
MAKSANEKKAAKVKLVKARIKKQKSIAKKATK